MSLSLFSLFLECRSGDRRNVVRIQARSGDRGNVARISTSAANQLCGFLGLLLFAHAAFAQTSIDTAERAGAGGGFIPDPGSASGWKTAPVFSEDEEEDIGVQYLLLERPRHKWVEISLDDTFSLTDNPLLLEDPDRSSTLNMFNITGAIIGKPFAFAGGQTRMRAGVRLSWFNYGLGSGRDEVIAGLPVDSNDFQSRAPFVEFAWERGAWFAFAGVRFNSLVQRDFNGRKSEFYHDYNPLWVISRRFSLFDKTDLWMQYTGDLRFSNTESGGLQPGGWNDRTNHGIGFSLHQSLRANLLLQGSYTFQYSHYFDAARTRDDTYHTVGAALLWAPNNAVRLRLFANYEVRRSNDPATSEYEKLDGGIGAQVVISF